MSIIKGLFLGLKNQKVIPFNQMTPELHNEISSGLAKIMMAAKMTKAKLTKSQREYIVNQAKQVQEFEDRYITGIKDKAGNIINKGKEKVADLFDLKGRKMDPTKSIIGGEQAGIMGIEKTSPKFIEYAIRNIKEMKNPQSVKDEINFIIKREGMYKNLTSDDAKQILEAVEPIVKKADGGRIGLKEGKGLFEQLFFSKDRPILSGLNTSALFDLVVAAKDAAGPLIGFADGGRIGYKDGPDQPGRRKFMKIAGGILGAIPFVGTKILSKATPVISKTAELTGPALDKIVETVMSLGKFVSLKGKRVKEMVTKKKHEGVEVTEDVADQSYIIKKGDKEIYYKPGRQDETGGFEDDIIEVIEDRVKKAGGGIGYMLGE
tara:strand:- start:221 stop:1351 length:1131 start_codon:yes stop_codon:yes gene_type:complete